MTFAHAAFDNRVTRDLGGACGVIETSSGELDAVQAENAKMRELTDRPFGVNIARGV